MPEAATELLKVAIFGPIVVVLGWYVLRLHRDLRDAQEKRTLDAQKVADTLVVLTNKWNETVNTLGTAVRDLKTAVDELRRNGHGRR
jgi:hypothetical protein